MDVMYYITMASIPDPGYQTQIGNVVARSSREALELTASNFRKTNKLPPSKFVNTRKLYESSDPQRAEEFYERLLEAVKETE